VFTLEEVDIECEYSGEGHSGAGWYVWDSEYPEDGSVFFDEEPTKVEVAFALGLEVTP
jgi:hypothetical protein